MKVTVIKGVMQDRLLVGFWIGSSVQNVIMGYTELKSFMTDEDIEIIQNTPFGIWKAWVTIKLHGVSNEGN